MTTLADIERMAEAAGMLPPRKEPPVQSTSLTWLSDPKRLLPIEGFSAGDKYIQTGYTPRDIDLTDAVNASAVSFQVDRTGLELTAYMTKDPIARLQPYEGCFIPSMHFRLHNIEAVRHPIGFTNLTNKHCAFTGAERTPMNEEQKVQNQAAMAKVIQNPEQQAIVDLKAKFSAYRDVLNKRYTEQTTLIRNQIHLLQRQYDELGQAVAQKTAALDKDEAEQLVALRAKLL